MTQTPFPKAFLSAFGTHEEIRHMKQRIVSLFLAVLICLLTASPALATDPSASYADIPDEQLEQLILDMLYDSFIEGIFSPDKQPIYCSASFTYSSEEAYGSASRTLHDTLRILVNSEDVEQKEYSYEALRRILPFQHDPLLEIKCDGYKPNSHWKYSFYWGVGNSSASSEASGKDEYRIDISITLVRSEGDFIDRLWSIAEDAKAASDTAVGQLEYVNDYLVKNFSYDYDAQFMGIYSNSVSEFLETGKGVCGSYVNTVNYLCFMLGIPCICFLTETADPHAWNCIYIDGAWKMLDVTLNDTNGKPRAYFLVDSINDSMHDWQNKDNADVVRCAKETAIGLQIALMTAAPEPASVNVKCGDALVRWTDAKPFIDENDRTMVPLRAVADALGLTVSWDSVNREAVFSDGTRTIYFPIGSTEARTGGGDRISMDTAAVIVSDRTYAPVRYLAEFFGYDVGWDGASRTVLIG